MRIKVLLLPFVAVLAIGALTACDPEPTGGPTPTAPASDTPTPSEAPVAPEPVVTRISVGSDMVATGDDEGFGLSWFRYDMTIDQALPMLRDAFGAEPTIVDHPGGHESPAYRAYSWGGFELHEMTGELTHPPYRRLSVRVSAESVGDIDIYAGGIARVGDPMATVIAAESGHNDWPDVYEAIIEPRPVDAASVGEAAGADLKIYVAVYGASGGAVDEYFAPAANWGV